MAKPRHQRDVSQLAAFIKANAPAAPACFESRDSWVLWLHEGEASGQIKVLKRDAQRRKLPEFRSDINYCQDCNVLHRNRMMRAGRCHPPESIPTTRSVADEFDAPAPQSMTAVVGVCLHTSAIRHYLDVMDVALIGLDPVAVSQAVESGCSYAGHAWAMPGPKVVQNVPKNESERVMSFTLGLLVPVKDSI